jgi:hypothetical protein
MPFALGTLPTGPIGFEAVSNIVAFAGGGQANATLLGAWVNELGTVVTAGDSVMLPAAPLGAEIWIINMGAASANIFPNFGDRISVLGSTAVLAANISVALAAGASTEFVCYIPQTKRGIIIAPGFWKQVV